MKKKRKKQHTIQPPWNTNIIHKFGITRECMSLMIDQSTKFLIETVETAKTISARADKLLAILLPLFSGLVIYISGINLSKPFTYLNYVAILSLFGIALSLTFCAFNLRKYHIAVPGEPPENIVVSGFVDNFIGDEYKDRQYISVGLAICTNIQARITQNNKTNNIRMAYNEWAFRILCAIPVACPLVSFALLNLHRHYYALAL